MFFRNFGNPVTNFILNFGWQKYIRNKLYVLLKRQCTILFINLVFDLKEQRRDYTEQLGKTLQNAFEIVDDTLRSGFKAIFHTVS